MTKLIEKLVRWLIEKFLDGYHLSRNPVRKKGGENADNG